MKTIRVDRQTLFEQVWSTPMSKLAHDYHITDRGLTKICKRLGIPRPAQGHWARTPKQRVAPTPLPKLKPGQETSVTLDVREEGDAPPKARQQIPQVPLSGKYAHKHPLVVETRKALSERKPNERGIVSPRRLRCLAVAVSRKQLGRALRIMDALIRVLESRNMKVTVERIRRSWDPDDGKFRTVVHCVGEAVCVSMGEQTHIVPGTGHTSEERRRARQEGSFLWGNPTRCQPGGELFIQLKGSSWAKIRKSWSDGKTQKLEDLLGSVVLAVQDHAVELAREREVRRREELARQEAARRAAEERRCRKHEKELHRDLCDMLERWRVAGQIRTFAAAVEQTLGDGAEEPTTAAYLAWIRSEADRVDPLCSPEDIPKPLEPAASGGS